MKRWLMGVLSGIILAIILYIAAIQCDLAYIDAEGLDGLQCMVFVIPGLTILSPIAPFIHIIEKLLPQGTTVYTEVFPVHIILFGFLGALIGNYFRRKEDKSILTSKMKLILLVIGGVYLLLFLAYALRII